MFHKITKKKRQNIKKKLKNKENIYADQDMHPSQIKDYYYSHYYSDYSFDNLLEY